MADIQPGQQWRHGWIPLTGAAAKSKNHGRKPKPQSKVAQAAAEAGAIFKRMQAQDKARDEGKPSTKATSKASTKAGPKASWPKSSSSNNKGPDGQNTPKGKPTAKSRSRTPAAKSKTPAQKNETVPAKTGTGKVSDAHVESSVTDFLKDFPEGRWATMTKLREHLAGIPRDQQDDVIRQMMLDGKVDIEPVAIYGDLKAKDRAAEIIIGSTPNHQIRRAR